MNIVFLADGSPAWMYVVNEIHATFPIDHIVYIENRPQSLEPQKKVKRKMNQLRKRGLVKFIDLLSHSLVNRFIRWDKKYQVSFFNHLDTQKIDYSSLKFNIPKTYVDDINSDESAIIIKSLHPDIIITRASALLGKQIFMVARLSTLNIHFGIIPEFRGGGNFYAIRNNQIKEVGVSVHCIDKGIDTGGLIDQDRITLDENDDLGSVGAKSLVLGVSLLLKTLKSIKKNGKLSILDTSNRKSNFYWSQYGLSEHLIVKRNLKDHAESLKQEDLESL